jgi:hypothetical protein
VKVPRLTARFLDWLVIAVMLLFGSIDLGAFVNRWLESPNAAAFAGDWRTKLLIGAFGLWSLTPFVAALLALRTRRWAAWVWLLGGLPAWLSAYVLLRVRLVGILESGAMAVVAGVLMAIEVYWAVTSALSWPPVLARLERISMRRVLAFAVIGIAVCGLGLACGAIVWAAPDEIGDCGGERPVTAPYYPAHVMFTATDFLGFGPASAAGGKAPGSFSNLAIARVHERFWGLPEYQKFVLLYRNSLWHGQTYLVDAMRARGLLGGFIPVVKVLRCGKSNPLRNEEVELRVLRSKPSSKGARIVGQARVVDRTDGLTLYRAKPGVKITITGPAGTMTQTSDDKGIYDFAGLPAGRYTFEVGPTSKAPRVTCRFGPTFDLEPDQIMECDATYR